MNNRIKLPAQEWLGYDPERGDVHGYTFEQMREFAELIVHECVNAVDRSSVCFTADQVRIKQLAISALRKTFQG